MFLYKISSAIIVAVVSAALGWFGYIESAGTTVIQQSATAVLGIRILICCIPALCLVLSAIFVKKLSLDKEDFNNVKKSISTNS
jgi:GPH family glycoside/pentoside/hexuronide:cation symporter